MSRQTEFDIALSFAGEDREYVDKVATILKSRGVSVFYDKYEEANLWGKNLYDYLTDIYSNKAFYSIMFISQYYKEKMWTNHERQAMQSRAFQENQEYILPARFDDTEIPGLLSTIGYISLSEKSPEEFCGIVFKKLLLGGRTIPSEQLRKSLSPLVRIPRPVPSEFVIRIKDERADPLNGVAVCLIADNNTHLSKLTGVDGKAVFTINVLRQYKLYVAHENGQAYMLERINPDENIELSLWASANIGSIICDGTCYIPGLKGRLNPILDTSNRTYLYANNIAINGGKPQPTTFKTGVPMDLEDCDGMIMQVTIKDIQGSVSLIEYVKPIVDD